MCWLAGSLTCRLPNVMRFPPARRSRKFNHYWLMFGSSRTRFLDQDSDAPQSTELLWTSDQLVAETSTWQHTTFTTVIHAPEGIRTHDLSRWAAADLRLRPRGHWDRQKGISFSYYKMFDKYLYKAGIFECFCFFVFHGICGFFNLFTTTHADSGLE